MMGPWWISVRSHSLMSHHSTTILLPSCLPSLDRLLAIAASISAPHSALMGLWFRVFAQRLPWQVDTRFYAYALSNSTALAPVSLCGRHDVHVEHSSLRGPFATAGWFLSQKDSLLLDASDMRRVSHAAFRAWFAEYSVVICSGLRPSLDRVCALNALLV